MIPQVIQKVFVLMSCTFLGLICGTLYLYSSYSPQFADRLSYTVTDSSTIALVGTIGVAVAGPLAGAVVDKKGYSVALCIGGLSIVSGYLGMKKQFDHQYSSLRVSSSLVFLIGIGSTFINSACLKCCAVSFPSIRGVATSLPLALYGLSALFYSVIASIFFPGDTSSFLGFLAYSAIVILAVCAPSIMICDREHKLRRTTHNIHPTNSIELNTLRPLMSMPASPQTSRPPRPIHARSPSYLYQESSHSISGIELVKSYEFWLIFIVTGTLASLGQMYIYSVGYMVKALISYKVNLGNIHTLQFSVPEIDVLIQKDQQLQVGLLSIANCIGRIASGILGDIVAQSFHKPRSRLLFVPCIGLMVCQVLGGRISEYPTLFINSLMTGFFYGFTFCNIPIIVGDIFGMDNFSSNWGIVGLAPILPSFYFTGLFGKIYDSNSLLLLGPLLGVEGEVPRKDFVCLLGNQCYNSIFSITLGVTFLALACVTLLNFGKKWFPSHGSLPLSSVGSPIQVPK